MTSDRAKGAQADRSFAGLPWRQPIHFLIHGHPNESASKFL